MATIPTHSSSYTNPQQAFKQSFISYSDQRTAGLAGLSKSLQSIGAWLQKENESQKALVAEQSATQLQMYGKQKKECSKAAWIKLKFQQRLDR